MVNHDGVTLAKRARHESALDDDETFTSGRVDRTERGSVCVYSSSPSDPPAVKKRCIPG